jgi:hypothetical protein
MDLAQIKTEIAKPEYDGLSDAAIADLLNAKMTTRSRVVPTWEVKKHAIEKPVLVCNRDGYRTRKPT